jgi:hypothetical protein
VAEGERDRVDGGMTTMKQSWWCRDGDKLQLKVTGAAYASGVGARGAPPTSHRCPGGQTTEVGEIPDDNGCLKR